MDEIRKNNILQMELKSGIKIEGTVLDYQKDRILVLISQDFINEAKNIKELDDICVCAHTLFGLKKMNSSTISSLNKDNCIIIENNDAIPVKQKRNFVRVLADFDFKLEIEGMVYKCKCMNISAGGVAFTCNSTKIKLDDICKITFPSEEFTKEIITAGEIIKIRNNHFVAKFINLNKYDEDKIVKRVFKRLSYKDR